jgi:putative PIN family toxin of toxin-antitoxin system
MTKFWVVDTNVLVSSFLFANSPTAKAFYILREKGIFLISDEIELEYEKVFYRKKFDKYVSLDIRIQFLFLIISQSLKIEITHHVDICRDKKDNMFLSLALSAKADAIITGDSDLLILNPFQEIPIITPAEYLIENAL